MGCTADKEREMNTGIGTTYVLLDRGVEDVALLREINKMVAATGISWGREFAKKYPTILALKQALESERSCDS